MNLQLVEKNTSLSRNQSAGLPPLRQYQEEIVNATLNVLRKTGKGVTICLPTGMGKTRVMIEILLNLIEQNRNVRIIVIVHSSKILDQISDELINAGIGHTLLVSASKIQEQPADNVTLAMSQTLDRRLQSGKLDNLEFDYMFADEAHRLLEQRLRTIQKWNIPVIATTATPARSDGRSLAEIAPFRIEGPTIKQGTEMGFLVPQETHRLPSPNLKNVRIRAGEYSAGDVEREFLADRLYHTVVHYWEKLAISDTWTPAKEVAYQERLGQLSNLDGAKIHKNMQIGGVRKYRQTMCFAPTVKTSISVVEAFNKAGYKFVHIDKNTDEKLKNHLLDALETHKIDGVVNVGMFVEGLDIRSISCIADLAPTLSVSKFLQIPGRGLRLSKETGKKTLKYLDFAGNTRTHGPIDADRDWSNGGVVRPYELDTMRVCDACRALVTATVLTCEVCGVERTALQILQRKLYPRLEQKYSKETPPRPFPAKLEELGSKLKIQWLPSVWNRLEKDRQELGCPLPIPGKRSGYTESIIARMLKESVVDTRKQARGTKRSSRAKSK